MSALYRVEGIRYFTLDELACPCCDMLKLIPGVYNHLLKLDNLRDKYGLPIIINSAYRCPKHNKEVGGAESSWHLQFATDIRPDIGNEKDVQQLYKIALAQNWGGIGLYTSWVHLDMRPNITRWRG